MKAIYDLLRECEGVYGARPSGAGLVDLEAMK